MTLTLISKAFAEDQPIPKKYARAGENLFPPLAWSGAPDETRSFALVVEDPDAPHGTFRHCGIANIPAEWSALSESVDTVPETAPRFYRNDFGNARYDGPQPPRGDRPHHYIFRLAALDVPKLSIPAAAGISAMWAEARKHALAEATVTGTYQTQ
ncbi:YbhB/YbcL family Raf kinase inhibitor-like protein [Rhizobium bangladeshense]|uniref:YbhB/YbcL family Raf kinase inhibitor-like protein n=1 Tax=Rhizobium bangladeshense TaxID=1138189 RepID=UPI001C82F89D|nr:YbhB/YbcL family Raf kinase inhibitor-like protein [Rhizobium bangladeshense]MBX4897130.1 YbhB/YbcL family Raf kinase inhibitor-like protein [Rhizobium bangladeshense]MBY3615849.1 YbhB/YbcL family Raf kinase inhibitor-like protein [Rhizobium bangladeshense]